jgi:hypothetical protein
MTGGLKQGVTLPLVKVSILTSRDRENAFEFRDRAGLES